jgi:N-acetyl-anhydromuramyl-L-alanine amidase AmpD
MTLIEQATFNVANIIQKPSNINKYNSRTVNGASIGSEQEAVKVVDTFVVHDPGIDNPTMTNERKLEITIAELTTVSAEKSAHYTLAYDGKLYQHVPLWKNAWHAGDSELYGRKMLNSTSIGIEVIEPYSEIQYITLAFLINQIRKTYTKIDPTRIVGHYEISPGRKTDPRKFNWDSLFKYMYLQ